MSSRKACSLALGKEAGRFHIVLEICSIITEFIFPIADGERAIRQGVWGILECAP